MDWRDSFFCPNPWPSPPKTTQSSDCLFFQKWCNIIFIDISHTNTSIQIRCALCFSQLQPSHVLKPTLNTLVVSVWHTPSPKRPLTNTRARPHTMKKGRLHNSCFFNITCIVSLMEKNMISMSHFWNIWKRSRLWQIQMSRTESLWICQWRVFLRHSFAEVSQSRRESWTTFQTQCGCRFRAPACNYANRL